MSGLEAIIYVVSISLVVGLLSGWMVQKKGYSFKQYFVSGFIASCGILGIVFKIIMDYLN
ncbi:MAG: hypothetical protein GQ574_23385 [Crocinitomix sp.]|nr:hypothetical protein [Crocinitomix sp.]